jgi:hypothetical protein
MKRRKIGKYKYKKSNSKKETNYIPTDDEVQTAIRKSKWGKSQLTKFLEDAHKNTLITYIKERGYFEMLITKKGQVYLFAVSKSFLDIINILLLHLDFLIPACP